MRPRAGALGTPPNGGPKPPPFPVGLDCQRLTLDHFSFRTSRFPSRGFLSGMLTYILGSNLPYFLRLLAHLTGLKFTKRTKLRESFQICLVSLQRWHKEGR